MIETNLKTKARQLRAAAVRLWRNQNGQDLIEYALVVALVAFAATLGMNSLATGINGAFTNIAAVLDSTIT
jgi:pilus assembly protein Flp/PilA